MSLTRDPSSVSGESRRRLGGCALVVILAISCQTTTQPAPGPAARPVSGFGEHLSLAVSLGSALRAGDKTVTARFALANNGTSTFEGCFGPSWGVSVIVSGHDAGHIVRSDHPRCDERLTLLPGQTIVWSRTVPLSNLRAGAARVTAWAKVVDPAACDPRSGCREISVPSPSMSVIVGER